ncbi:MAG: triose-phosphate isomerase [Fimbriimonadaceae bacterium]|jgi:triosephosphate isomerase|nr:triose-phosphate isomerase [Fimbriimonadaceae bacterium]
MRTKLVAGNWKMNLISTQGAALVDGFLKRVEVRDDVDIVVCPPFLSIPRIRDVVRNSAVKLGAQNVFWKDDGAYTGQVSAKQLHEFCVDFCIVGHSETRGKFGVLEVPETTVPFFGETDETINLKIKNLLFYGITPILCVGETLAEREEGKTDEVIKTQLLGALAGIDGSELYQFVVAYEPVWAIGTGKVCDTAEAQRVCRFIRATIGEFADPEVAEDVRILYGGSVKPNNAKELFSQPDIDGGLIGGASLDGESFLQIISSA